MASEKAQMEVMRPYNLGEYVRDTAGGYLMYLATGGKAFGYPEDAPGWSPPSHWKTESQALREKEAAEKQDTTESSGSSQQTAVDAPENGPGGGEKGAVKEALADEARTAPTDEGNDYIIVEWYGPNDPANPHNWPNYLKGLFLGILMWLTFCVYMGASVISPGIPYLVAQYDVSDLVATLSIALYVLGYGLGPLIFSPLSEIPSIGRLPMYVAPLFLFFAVGFAAVFTPTFGGLLAVRFITGFLASPPLATGGASVGDVLSPINFPLGLCLWVVAAYQGPGLGPTIVGFAVQNFGTWRWSFAIYQMFIVVCLGLTFFLMPETSGPNILLRRAQRIRKATGNDRYRSQGEIDQKHLKAKDLYYDAIVKPFEITIKDPSIAYINLYVGLLYAFYYLFFAAFPIIFFEEYGFGIGTGELPYLVICVGGSIFCAFYMCLYKFYVVPLILSGKAGEPEESLAPALPASILSAASLFAIGWSAGRTSYWAPIVFTGVFGGSNFVILQPLFAYMAQSYPTYAASLFAANDAIRSTFAFGFLIAGGPLFNNLGIGPGCSLTGGLTALLVPPLFLLKAKGKALRERSKFTVKNANHS